eukprot:15440965-Alexandrium_andersonii.AAC.1
MGMELVPQPSEHAHETQRPVVKRGLEGDDDFLEHSLHGPALGVINPVEDVSELDHRKVRGSAQGS